MRHFLVSYVNQNPACESGDEFDSCNLFQNTPKEICADKTNLKFRNCQLINCILPPDSDIDNTNNNIKIDYCYHLHKDNIPLEEEIENCRHVIDVNELVIDGQVVSVTYKREDKILGK